MLDFEDEPDVHEASVYDYDRQRVSVGVTLTDTRVPLNAILDGSRVLRKLGPWREDYPSPPQEVKNRDTKESHEEESDADEEEILRWALEYIWKHPSLTIQKLEAGLRDYEHSNGCTFGTLLKILKREKTVRIINGELSLNNRGSAYLAGHRASQNGRP